MATHSSTLAWKIPWTEEPGRLQSMGSLRVRHDSRLHFHFSLSRIGEGNGNPLQCSCLENPRDSGAWWAAVYEVAQSRTRLKQLSSSSSKSLLQHHNLKASILWHSDYFMIQLSHLYMTTGKTIALIIRTLVGKVMSLLLNMLSRFFIAFLPRSLLISWLQLPFSVILLLLLLSCFSRVRLCATS